MLRRKIFFSIVFLSAVLLSYAYPQDKETLAVLDFKTEAVSETEMNAIVEFLSAELFNTDKYIVIDVSQRQTILEEMEFSMSGCTDDSCALEIGKMLSAELIVTGNLSKVGSRYLMSVKLLQTETSRTMGTANGKFGDLDELIDGLEEIAFTLAGAEVEAVAAKPVPEPEPKVEPEPEPEPEPKTETEAEAAENAVSEPEVKDEAKKPSPSPEKEAASGDFNWLSFGISTLGTVGYMGAGLFTGMAASDMMLARDAYELYMSATDNVEILYSGSDGYTYDDYYEYYKAETIGSMIMSGAGGALSATALFTGGNNYSLGGKIMSSGGMIALTAAQFLSSIATNTAVNNETLYKQYQTASEPSIVSNLYDEYEASYNKYTVMRYTGYALFGTGGALSIAAALIPGEKASAQPGILNKILAGVGYVLFSGGNFASSLAFSKLIEAEDAYDEYLLAVTDTSTSETWNIYDELQGQYEMQTYMSYGLWGGGAALVLASMFIPYNQPATQTAEANTEWYIKPASTGFGFEVQIKLK